jgi:hypothetical protein
MNDLVVEIFAVLSSFFTTILARDEALTGHNYKKTKKKTFLG